MVGLRNVVSHTKAYRQYGCTTMSGDMQRIHFLRWFQSWYSRHYTQVRTIRNILWNMGYTIVTGKRSLTLSSQRRKEERFSFAPLRETCPLNCQTFMCTDKYRHTCV